MEEAPRFADPLFFFLTSVGQLNDGSKHTEGEELLVEAVPAEALRALAKRLVRTENRRVPEQ